MTDQDLSTLHLARAAARSATIDELAGAALSCVSGHDVDAAAVWTRSGHGGWHTVLRSGPAPGEPPEHDAGWQLLHVDSERHTTTLGLTPARLSPTQGDLLRTLLEVGVRRLEAEAAVHSVTQAGEQRLATILEATPDAIVVVALDGEILRANRRASELFGYTDDELVGSQLERLIPASLRAGHRGHRDAYAAAPTSRSMAAGRDLHAVHRDGTEVPVDIALEPMEVEGGTAVAAFIRDATARRRAEEHRQELAKAEMAKQQALELNDNVVQGLTSAIWLLEIGEVETGLQATRDTLDSARTMMLDLLGGTAAGLEPGMLRRATAAPPSGLQPPAPRPPEPDTGTGGDIRVVVADDSEDMRFLLQLRMEGRGLHLVAAVGDGRAAVEAVDEHRPDVVIMDLSMPVLDGLQATAMIRERHPQVRIVVLSGHPRDAMVVQAMAAGADAYVQKGSDFDELIDAVREVV